MAPTFSVVIPTKGRRQLRQTLRSIPRADDVEVILVGDGPQVVVREIAETYGCRYLETLTPTWDVGHTQRNFGMAQANGRWLLFMDDDDVYAPGAFDLYRGVQEYRPHIFKMRYAETGEELWHDQRVHPGNVGTPMWLVPNIPGKLGGWVRQRGGDFNFISKTCELQGQPIWRTEVVAIIRPFGTE